MDKLAEIGVFGGSGFYKFLENVQEVPVNTPYGIPSDSMFIGEIGGHKVAFMPRHGRYHTIPPHLINYRANVWAMKHIGCKRVISPCAAGSLQKNVQPGEFVICDQFVDWTDGRKSTFYEGPIVTHTSAAETYCPELRNLAVATAKELNIKVIAQGIETSEHLSHLKKIGCKFGQGFYFEKPLYQIEFENLLLQEKNYY